jgi:hypothetical protein
MKSVNGFNFYALNFDEKGSLTEGNEFQDFRQAAGIATDAIFLAHGFRNDVNDATSLYTKFLGTFRGHLARPEFAEIAGRKYIVGAVYWPSKALPESFTIDGDTGGVQAADPDLAMRVSATLKLALLKELVPEKAAALDQAAALLPLIENDSGVQDQFTALVLQTLEGSVLDATEGLPLVQQQRGSDMLPKLSAPVIVTASDENEGGVQALDSLGNGVGGVESFGSVVGTILGGVDKFLNLTTWYIMKNRSGVVGETGVAQAVRDTRAANASIRIHLVGHSLGGRLMAGCAKSLAQAPLLQPDSMTLLEAAFSHYGFSANNGKGLAGYFRDVIVKHVVKGPLIETFSAQDTVVGLTYSVASRLADDNTKAIGDADDEFGGIGRNGAIKTTESSFQPLRPAVSLHAPYVFRTGLVNCLDGSGGLIKDHGDITNADVTYAFASAVASTAVSESASVGASG